MPLTAGGEVANFAPIGWVIGIHPAVRSSPMTVGEVLRRLRSDGWYLVATRGGHRQLKHPSQAGRVTVAGKPNDDVPPRTLSSIPRQPSLKR